MSHIETNTPWNIFYPAIKGEFSRISRSITSLTDFKLKSYQNA